MRLTTVSRNRADATRRDEGTSRDVTAAIMTHRVLSLGSRFTITSYAIHYESYQISYITRVKPATPHASLAAMFLVSCCAFSFDSRNRPSLYIGRLSLHPFSVFGSSPSSHWWLVALASIATSLDANTTIVHVIGILNKSQITYSLFQGARSNGSCLFLALLFRGCRVGRG